MIRRSKDKPVEHKLISIRTARHQAATNVLTIYRNMCRFSHLEEPRLSRMADYEPAERRRAMVAKRAIKRGFGLLVRRLVEGPCLWQLQTVIDASW